MRTSAVNLLATSALGTSAKARDGGVIERRDAERHIHHFPLSKAERVGYGPLMRRLLVYQFPDGRVSTCLKTIDQQNRRVVDQWATYADGEPVFVGIPPLDEISLIETVDIPNDP
jgi:hypothetical protein